MPELFDVEPFVYSRPKRGPLPYLWAKCDPFQAAEPIVHDVEETEEGFAHRFVWRDNTGLRCRALVGKFSAGSVANMYRKARAIAEEVEFYAAGAIVH